MFRNGFSLVLKTVFSGKICLVALLLLFMPTVLHADVVQYAGIYSGTFEGEGEGDDHGQWISLIEPWGAVQLIFWSDVQDLVDGSDNLQIDDEGRIAGSTELGTEVNIVVNDDGSVTGDWSFANGETSSGIIEGQRNDPDAVAEYAGPYSGSFRGDNLFGSWSFRADKNGYISGSISAAGEEVSLKGAVDASGHFISYVVDRGGLTGDIEDDGRVAGEWRVGIDPSDTQRGTFSGDRESGSSSTSAGCFISSALK